MTRFGLALALFICVIVALTVPPAFSQFAQKLEGHVEARADNFKADHSAGDTM